MGVMLPNKLVTPHIIHPWMANSCGLGLAGTNEFLESGADVAASVVWPGANAALYFPFTLWEPTVPKIVVWRNGTAVSGTVSVGVYTQDGRRLFTTGAVTHTGTSVIQTTNIGDVLIEPGRYYLAMSCSNTTSAFSSATATTVQDLRGLGILKQETAHPLPATATMVTTTYTYVPLFGLSLQTLI